MGNCLDRMTAGEGGVGTEKCEFAGEITGQDRGEKGGEGKAAAASTMVKIVITRKQWEELMSHADQQGLDAYKLLSHMTQTLLGNVGRGQQMWRPSLQSIPEASE